MHKHECLDRHRAEFNIQFPPLNGMFALPAGSHQVENSLQHVHKMALSARKKTPRSRQSFRISKVKSRRKMLWCFQTHSYVPRAPPAVNWYLWSECCVTVGPLSRLTPRQHVQNVTFNTPKTRSSRWLHFNCAWNGAWVSHCRGRFVWKIFGTLTNPDPHVHHSPVGGLR